MFRLLLAVSSFLIACEFAAGMHRLKSDISTFYDSRRHFLADPGTAAAAYCRRPKDSGKERFCRLSVSIRTESVWDDVCRFPHSSTFHVERFYKITLTCRTSVLTLPPFENSNLMSLVKR